MLRKISAVALLCFSGCIQISCDHRGAGQQNAQSGKKHDSVLNFYNWADYIAPDTIASFEKLTAIKVHTSYLDSNEVLESRMLTGSSGFDVIVTAGPYFQRQVRSGAYLPLDKKQLPNLAHLDPAIMAQAALYDSENAHGVVYTWGSFGIGYNEKMVAEALPNVPLNSWSLIFDPAFASKLSNCGINIIDSPASVTRLVLMYLGKNPNTPSSQDVAAIGTVLTNIRPYIRTIDSSGEIEAMANGDICISLGYNGDFIQARRRASDAKNGIKVDYVIPREGSLLWFDLLAIPRDAPNVANAHVFINYLMNPQVMAGISNFIGFASANSGAAPLLDSSIVTNTTIYPTADERQRLVLQLEDSPEQMRAITRIWQKFKTAQ